MLVVKTEDGKFPKNDAHEMGMTTLPGPKDICVSHAAAQACPRVKVTLKDFNNMKDTCPEVHPRICEKYHVTKGINPELDSVIDTAGMGIFPIHTSKGTITSKIAKGWSKYACVREGSCIGERCMFERPHKAMRLTTQEARYTAWDNKDDVEM